MSGPFKEIAYLGEPAVSEGFNEFFLSIGAILAKPFNKGKNDKNFKKYLKNKPPSTFHFRDINIHDLLKVSKELKSKDSTGDDGISTRLLKDLIPAIPHVIIDLINSSLRTGYFPPQLKIAKVIQVYKSGPKDEFTNYHPISLLPALSKVYEKVVIHQFTRYLNSHNLLYNHQYGFRKKHGGTHAVLQFLNRIFQGFTKSIP